MKIDELKMLFVSLFIEAIVNWINVLKGKLVLCHVRTKFYWYITYYYLRLLTIHSEFHSFVIITIHGKKYSTSSRDISLHIALILQIRLTLHKIIRQTSIFFPVWSWTIINRSLHVSSSNVEDTISGPLLVQPTIFDLTSLNKKTLTQAIILKRVPPFDDNYRSMDPGQRLACTFHIYCFDIFFILSSSAME